MTKKKRAVDPLASSTKALLNSTSAIHIHELRFPNYRNLALGARLPLDFPITVLLGRNGTNKSSILHALYGSVEGNTVADYWFETDLDAIPQTEQGLKQSVTHSYKDNKGNLVECIKARAPRHSQDPDYWEPVKPTGRYGFPPNSNRVPPVSLNVVHLDFRGELPAFDKYFYFPDAKHIAARARHAKKSGTLRRAYRKQDYLRRRSGLLKRALQESGVELGKEGLRNLCYILERSYTGAKLLEHDIFHGHAGWTVLFESTQFDRYSEAFAGSGESAAALLVHKVLSAPDRSLILLDEPETSLHPRAQQRVLEFLAHQAVRKSLQVVVATHSIYFAEGLPQAAIRVLVPNPCTGRVSVSTTHSAAEALHQITTLAPGKTILVEDERAKLVVLSALEQASPEAADEFNVVVRTGGAAAIYRDIVAYSKSERDDVYVVFDGDQRPSAAMPEPGSLPQGDDELKRLIRRLTGGPKHNGPDLKLADAREMTGFIDYMRRCVGYLPSTTPEELVWSDAAAATLVGQQSVDDIASESDGKLRIERAASARAGLTTEAVFSLLLTSFLDTPSTQLDDLRATINKIRAT